MDNRAIFNGLVRGHRFGEVYILMYTLCMEEKKKAKLFQNGGSQAVRLPKEFRFEDQEEVIVRREGRLVILEPADEWSENFKSLFGSWTEDIERPGDDSLSEL